MRLFDAHNHLQDPRFGSQAPALLEDAARRGVEGMVVNGSVESDWDAVASLARSSSRVLPAFGLHPWYLSEASPRALEDLRERLEADPRASVGEIGLDGWMLDQPHRWRAWQGPDASDAQPPSMSEQETWFIAQWQLAADQDRAASVHCLQAFGRLLKVVTTAPRLTRGFLLHSYGGPAEMIPAFARLGARFSFPGYFLHPRKARQRATFRSVPADRLLVETDAPDQLLPDDRIVLPLSANDGAPLNHPANLEAIYAGLADLRGEPVATLAKGVEHNFHQLFGH